MSTPPSVTEVPATRGRRERRKRVDQLEANRAALIRAAAEVVGEDGYAKASVVKITSRAGLGQGTFYTYFDSRQDLFNILLPEVGEDIRAFFRQRIAGLTSVLDVEVASFQAFADYVLANPWYGRILFEAATLAPVASRANAERDARQHVNRLTHAWVKGELAQYEREQIPALSSVLLSLRRHFARSRMQDQALALAPEALVEVSLRMIRSALAPQGAPSRQGPPA